MIKQGHAYKVIWRNESLIALESRESGMVRCLCLNADGYPTVLLMQAVDLVAQPMAYYRNQIP